MYKFFKDHHFLLDFLFADSIDRWPPNASSCKPDEGDREDRPGVVHDDIEFHGRNSCDDQVFQCQRADMRQRFAVEGALLQSVIGSVPGKDISRKDHDLLDSLL